MFWLISVRVQFKYCNNKNGLPVSSKYKGYSSISSRNKHEKKKGQCSENNIDPDISFNEETKLCHCPTAGFATTAKYKYNIVKHLQSCYSVNKNWRKVADNKICKVYGKKFAKKSNRDQKFHTENNHDSVAEDYQQWHQFYPIYPSSFTMVLP